VPSGDLPAEDDRRRLALGHAAVVPDDVDAEAGVDLRELRDLAEAEGRVAHLHDLAEVAGDLVPDQQVADDRLAEDATEVRRGVPGAEPEPLGPGVLAQLRLRSRGGSRGSPRAGRSASRAGTGTRAPAAIIFSMVSMNCTVSMRMNWKSSVHSRSRWELQMTCSSRLRSRRCSGMVSFGLAIRSPRIGTPGDHGRGNNIRRNSVPHAAQRDKLDRVFAVIPLLAERARLHRQPVVFEVDAVQHAGRRGRQVAVPEDTHA
jgi:hypothetical protein